MDKNLIKSLSAITICALAVFSAWYAISKSPQIKNLKNPTQMHHEQISEFKKTDGMVRADRVKSTKSAPLSDKNKVKKRDISKIRVFEEEEEEEVNSFTQVKVKSQARSEFERRVQLRQRLLNNYLLTTMNNSLKKDYKYKGRRVIGSQYIQELIKTYDDNPN